MSVFKFKHFDLAQASSTMKVGTDAMLLGSLINSNGRSHALDIGAGTGVLSLMVAQCNPNIRITAIEIDHLSAEECAMNFNSSLWKDRLICVQEDFSFFKTDAEFDLIFSNPPYYQSRLENSDKRMSLAKHESNLPMSILVEKCSRLLSQDGEVWLIFPFNDLEKWIKEFSRHQMNLVRLISISGKVGEQPNRTVATFSKSRISSERSSLAVRKEDGTYTDEYKELTKEFHYNTL